MALYLLNLSHFNIALESIIEKCSISGIKQAVFELKVVQMLKKIAVISITIMTLAVGCQERQPLKKSVKIVQPHQKIATSSGLVEYLMNQHLPTVTSVDAWNNDLGEGLKIITEHYEVYSTLKEPLMLRDVPAFLEACFNNFQRQAGELFQTSERFAIYLFDNRSQWERFTEGFAGRQSEMFGKLKVGAYYLNGSCVAYNIGRERTFMALGHECWHQFADRCFKFRLPSWLNEGIAMQFEANKYEGGLFSFRPVENSYRLDMLKKTIAQNQIIPLEELLETDPGGLVGSGSRVSAFYSQCYALVRFLREAEGGKKPEQFNLMLADGLKGKWLLSDEEKRAAANRGFALTKGWNRIVGPQLFKQYFGSNIEKIEKEYLDFCKEITKGK
jgi:hypothetical protein